ncbi:sigma-70 family RNA polymerase sigma factor [Cryptosporangium minutisporangium]|uniref:sigma-70 family RNA polymerase sigma factor n=1 Tax=Cryptosporangium minutisporangium TaxID=113569 RepID=UPI0035EF1482
MTDVRATVDAVWRLESARIIGALTRMLGDVGLAEELAQDALVAALEQWSAEGPPANPAAWLTTVAKRRAVDHLRRSQRADRAHELIAGDLRRAPEAPPEPPEYDDVLRLIFVTCHPVLSTEARVALTLRLVAGLTPGEIARAFLVSEPTIAQRLAGAKQTLADRRVPFALPDRAHLSERLASVLEVVYLVFNEGYSATSGDDLIRADLCHEALRLGRLLAELAPDEAEVHGLVALLEIQASRAAARTGPSGEPVPLHEQNRGRWDPLLIRRGFTAMLRAREIGAAPGPYVLQAAIAVCHAQAGSADDTDWARIASLYDALVHVLPTPIVQLNRAVAVGRARGAQAGLDLADPLVTDARLRDYHLLPAVRADLLATLGRHDEARREFERAAALTRNAAEAAFLRRRADALPVSAPAGPTLGTAATEFLERNDLTATTRRSYTQTLDRLRRALGDGLPLDALTAAAVAPVLTMAWGDTAAATWNRHRAAVRSFGTWAGLPDLSAAVARRDETRTPTPPVDASLLDALESRPDVALRERTLWRLLHESGAPVRTVLALDVENLDLDDRRARAGRTWVTWRSGTARLLPELIAGRTRGPLFLTDRRPGPARTPAAADRCPDTGRRRLSYERAEYLFKQATAALDPAGAGSTLRQLKPSRCGLPYPGRPPDRT